MRLSVIVATRDRAYAIVSCLDSIAASLAKAAPVDAEIVVVDNASRDDTSPLVKRWARNCSFPVQTLVEPRAGRTRAINRALRNARGELLAFTDDDCRASPDYVSQLLSHAGGDTEPVFRGGRVELGDPTDLPLSIITNPDPKRWTRRENSARHQPIPGEIIGCNMTMPRAMVEELGPFDERFGPGSIVGAGGDDDDYLFRAYLAGFTLEYVPDMTIFHCHGRKTPAEGRTLLEQYMMGYGALLVKHGRRDPDLARPFYRTCKSAIKELLAGGINRSPFSYFSDRDMVRSTIRGGIHYLTKAARLPAATPPETGA